MTAHLEQRVARTDVEALCSPLSCLVRHWRSGVHCGQLAVAWRREVAEVMLAVPMAAARVAPEMVRIPLRRISLLSSWTCAVVGSNPRPV